VGEGHRTHKNTYDNGSGEDERKANSLGIQLDGIAHGKVVLVLCCSFGIFKVVDDARVDLAHLADSRIIKTKNSIVGSLNVDD
jgi:hypothetical protein